MSPQEFTYWLQGALEMNPEMLERGMTPEQTKMIQDHLDLVFTKVTQDRTKDKSVEGILLSEEKSETPELKDVSKEDLEVIFPSLKEYHPFPGSPGGTSVPGNTDGLNTILC